MIWYGSKHIQAKKADLKQGKKGKKIGKKSKKVGKKGNLLPRVITLHFEITKLYVIECCSIKGILKQ